MKTTMEMAKATAESAMPSKIKVTNLQSYREDKEKEELMALAIATAEYARPTKIKGGKFIG